MSSDGTNENPFLSVGYILGAGDVRDQYNRGFKIFTRKNVSRLLGYVTELEKERKQILEKLARAKEEREKWRTAATVLCGAHIGKPQDECPVCKLEQVQKDHEGACQTIATMHAAAVGEVRGPSRGVVEDVADLRQQLEETKQALLQSQALCDRLMADIDRQNDDISSVRALLFDLFRQRHSHNDDTYSQACPRCHVESLLREILEGGE